MSIGLYQAVALVITMLGLGFSGDAPRATKGMRLLKISRVEFVRGPAKQAHSPDGKASVNLLPPKDEDSDPVMEAYSDTKIVRLGALRRSAFVYWRPDSKVAVLWDLAYSDHYFVRLVRVEPKLQEVRGFDQEIKGRVLRQFHSGELLHYWPYVEGWTEQNELLVIVCADAVPPKSPAGTPLRGFERGYLVDTEGRGIRSELTTPEFIEIVGSNPCQ